MTPRSEHKFAAKMLSGVACSSAGVVVSAVSYPLYLHFLGADLYGLWLLLVTVIAFAQIGSAGLTQAVIQQVAEEMGKGNREGARASITAAHLILALTAIACVAAVLATRHWIADLLRLPPAHAAAMQAMVPWVALLSAYVFFVDLTVGAVTGLGRIDLANYAQSGMHIASTTAALALLWAGGGLWSMFAATAAGYVALHAASLAAVVRLLGAWPFSLAALERGRMRRLAATGATLMGTSVFGMALSPVNKMFLARYAGLGAIPLYEIAFTAAMRIRNVFEPAQRALLPALSAARALHGTLRAQPAARMQKTGFTVIWCCLPLYLALFVFADYLLRAWLASRFDPRLPAMFRIMLAGTFVSLLGTPAYFLLLAAKRAGAVLVSHALQFGGAVAVVVLSLAATASVTPLMVTTATACGMLLSTLYLAAQRRRTLAAEQNADR